MKKRMIRSDIDWSGAWEQITDDAKRAGDALGSLFTLVLFMPLVFVVWLWVPEQSAERTAWEAERRKRYNEDV
ncbi:hypothetical protein D3C77_34320 [compost metagenome]